MKTGRAFTPQLGKLAENSCKLSGRGSGTGFRMMSIAWYCYKYFGCWGWWEMDRPRHPQVVRTWKVERIRKPPSGASKKNQQPRPVKKSRP